MSNIVCNGKEKTNKSSAGRKPRKPNYDANAILQEQMDAAVHLYNSDMSLQAIADELSLNPIKVRKLLITAGVYESNTAESVQHTFNMYRKKQSYKDAVLSTAATLQLSKASVTSYLPYEKGVYFQAEEQEKISVGAERQRRYRAVKLLKMNPCEETLWNCKEMNIFTADGLNTLLHEAEEIMEGWIDIDGGKQNVNAAEGAGIGD